MKQWTHELYAQIEKDRKTMTLWDISVKYDLGITASNLRCRLEKYKVTGEVFVEKEIKVINKKDMLRFFNEGLTKYELHFEKGYTYYEIELSEKSTGIKIPKSFGLRKKEKKASVVSSEQKVEASDSLIAKAPEDIKALLIGSWKNNHKNTCAIKSIC